MPSWIGRKVKQSPETSNIGFGETSNPRPILFGEQDDRNDPHPTDLLKEPVNPDAQNEFSDDKANGIIAELLKDGYHVQPDHGVSLDRKHYQIRVLKAGAEDRLTDLKDKLGQYGFDFVNFQERYGYLFAKELRGDRQ